MRSVRSAKRRKFSFGYRLRQALEWGLWLTFLVAFAARFWRPDPWFWWVQMLAVALPVLALAVTLFASWAFLRGSVRRKLMYGALLLLVFHRFAPAGCAASPDEIADGPPVLDILTYNYSRWWQPDDEGKAEALMRMVRNEQPELVVLQKAPVFYVPGGLSLAPHVRLLRDSLDYRVGRTVFARPRYSPQPVFSASMPLRVEEMRLRPDSVAVPMYLTRVYFSHDNREAVLYNVHLRSFGADKPWHDETVRWTQMRTWWRYVKQYQRATLIRAWEADTLRALIDAETVPVIVAGDFNSTTHNWVVRRITAGLQDVWRSGGKGWGGTYHVRLPLVRIDFVFADPAFEVLHARTFSVSYSDHRPVRTSLRWRPPLPSASADGEEP